MLTFSDLEFSKYLSHEGVCQLDQDFLIFLKANNVSLHDLLLHYRNEGFQGSDTEYSDFLIALSEVIESYLSIFFDIEVPLQSLQDKIIENQPIFLFKTEYVKKRAKRRLLKNEDLPPFEELNKWIIQQTDNGDELSIAQYALDCLEDQDDEAVEKITAWCIHQFRQGCDWVSFRFPSKLDFQHLIPTKKIDASRYSLLEIQDKFKRFRDGFDLTDPRMNELQVQSEIEYCVYCHKNEDDFCRKGFPKSKKQPELGFKKNPLDVTLHGCPLDENISEMHLLKKEGFSLAALAMIMKENPMCAATGHRICNDCMKSCIYQKQDPVNIPQIETRVLTDILDLPFGVEIYDLLTRWNPLRQEQYIEKSYNGKKIMVAGLGPAGFTMAHHLLMEGCAVVGFDGLKLEPLQDEYIKKPIQSYESINERLSQRVMAGFGGVAEYGITVRWDKNFLKLIYINLIRRPHFQAFGNTRFGGTVKVEDAWELGFDHLCIAVGAGLPKALPIPGSMAPGMRQANDFLMALQLTGAAKKDSLTNLQLRMPVLVIGGGLTGIDTATEAQAYYLVQIEKTKHRYDLLVKELGEETLRQQFKDVDLEILDEHLLHAEQVRYERKQAELEGRNPDLQSLITAWGGVRVVYRRTMQESPAYISNHEEVQKALEEGVLYAENLWPKEVLLDEHGQVSKLRCKVRHHDADGEWTISEDNVDLSTRSILVATGAQLNVAYAFEHSKTFQRDGMKYRTYENLNGKLEEVSAALHVKDDDFGPFTSYDEQDKRVSFIGDSHPVFHGNVVKAIASAKRTYPLLLENIKPINKTTYNEFSQSIESAFSSTIIDIKIFNDKVMELTVKNSLASKSFKPGYFYRLQNFETTSKKINDVLLQTEAIPVFGKSASDDCLTLSIIDNGVSSHLCKTFKKGDPVALMGPTGVASRIKERETMLIIGNELAAIQAISFGQSLKHSDNTLIYLGLNSTTMDPYQNDLNAVCDQVIMADQVFEALGKLKLKDVHRILVVGSPEFMSRFKAYQKKYADTFHENVKTFGSAYTPMQCMLKGVCSQCLQWQIDPNTGQRTKAVFGCSWQNQPLELIDLNNLNERNQQNRMQEVLTRLYCKTIL